ncbi:head-tail adaptor protein [Zhongshania guokunii]|uniref:Head-tail adaptor protein n=1 Tax=Zhongshania guokunii TaxID=641783 RepID=A0ABV3U5A6_9GAMM
MRLGPLRHRLFLLEQGRDSGGNINGVWSEVVKPKIWAEKLTESSGTRKAAAGEFGYDTVTYRMRYRSDLDRTKALRSFEGRVMTIVGIENVRDLNQQLLVTVRDRQAN